MRRILAVLACILAVAGCAPKVAEVYSSRPWRPGSEAAVAVSVAVKADPFEAGKAAAEALRRRMVNPPLAVLVSECFEGEARKKKALRGVCSVFPPQIVFGGATYGSFTQAGCALRDSVALLAIGGEGLSVAAALERDLGVAALNAETDKAEVETRLHAAGARLASKLPEAEGGRLLIVVADAHSPKNGPLVEGLQSALTKGFPITGGSANKNAGQTYVYFQGRMFQDSALALLLSGEFSVAMAGRQAKENDLVIATAREAAQAALGSVRGKPFAALAFDCAGRKGKLTNPDEEVVAMKKALGSETPLFGCYCAGEIGPADAPGAKPNDPSSGVGWHVMFTVLGR